MCAQRDWLISQAVVGAFVSDRFDRLLPMLEAAGALEATVEGLSKRAWRRGPDPRLLALMDAHPTVRIPEGLLLDTAERAVASDDERAFHRVWQRIEPVMGSCEDGWTRSLQSALDRRGDWGSWLPEFAERHTAAADPADPRVLRLLATGWDLRSGSGQAGAEDIRAATARARELWKQLWAQAPELGVARGLAAALRRSSIQHLLDGELSSAEHDLAESLELLLASSESELENRDLAVEAVLTAGRLAEVQRDRGHLLRARATADSVRELAEASGLASLGNRRGNRGLAHDGFTTVMGANSAAFTHSWAAHMRSAPLQRPGSLEALGTLRALWLDRPHTDDPAD